MSTQAPIHVNYHYTSMATSRSHTSCFNRFRTYILALNWTVREKSWNQEVRHAKNHKKNETSTNEEQNNGPPGFAHSRSSLQRLYARVCVLLCAYACSWAMRVYVSARAREHMRVRACRHVQRFANPSVHVCRFKCVSLHVRVHARDALCL